jgi:Chaperone of endosialidase
MLSDYILENCSSPGTGTTVSLAGAVSGRRSFAQGFTTGAAVYYYLDDGTQAEWGSGVFTTGTPNTVSRGTVIGNTAGTTARLNFSGVTKIYNALPASRESWLDGNLAKTTGMMVDGADAGGFHFRSVNGSFGAGFLNNGTSGMLLSTAAGSQYATYNSYRPFQWNLSTGAVTIGNGAAVSFGGSALSSISTIATTSTITAGGAISGTGYSGGTISGVTSISASGSISGGSVSGSTVTASSSSSMAALSATSVTASGSVSGSTVSASSSSSMAALSATSVTASGAVSGSTVSTTGTATFGGNIFMANTKGVYGTDTGATTRPLLVLDGTNYVSMWLANAGTYWRVLNLAGTTNLILCDNSGNVTTNGNLYGGATVKAGNAAVGGGYLCRAGISGAFSSNQFNFYWSNPNLQVWVDGSNLGNMTITSDGRFKHRIEPMPDGALTRILSLRPVTYRWRDKEVFRDDHKTHEGFIAQEVREVIPAAVHDGETLSLDTYALIGVLTKAMQELTGEVRSLKAEVAMLKGVVYG